MAAASSAPRLQRLCASGDSSRTPHRTLRSTSRGARPCCQVSSGRDVVIDACGPFHQRTTILLEVAIKVGLDVVDLSDNLGYALAVQAMDERLKAAAVRVFTSCSAVSAVTAAAVRKSGIQEPIRVSVCLLPAGRDTSSSGTAASLLRSLSCPIHVLHDDHLTAAIGWSRSKVFRVPFGRGEVRG